MNSNLSKAQWWVIWITGVLLSVGSVFIGLNINIDRPIRYTAPYLLVLQPLMIYVAPLIIIAGLIFFSLANPDGRIVMKRALRGSFSILLLIGVGALILKPYLDEGKAIKLVKEKYSDLDDEYFSMGGRWEVARCGNDQNYTVVYSPYDIDNELKLKWFFDVNIVTKTVTLTYKPSSAMIKYLQWKTSKKAK